MKVNSGLFSLALAGFSALAAAQPHGIHHRHAARDNNMVTEYATEYVTVTGHAPTATGSPTVPTGVSSDHDEDKVPSPSVSAPATPSSSSSSTSSDNFFDLVDASTGKGVDSNPNVGKTFPDGTIDCDKFPFDYGAIPLKWVTKQGWSGIQIGGGNGDAVGECKEGALCSYACPAGYSKSQWPENQPASGESHGGLLCKGGKLHLTRPDYPQLCQAGAGGVTIKNELKKFVSICRTDYPGSENMVVPLACDSGSEKDLTVPDSAVSYKWKGMSTSAQYYVNNAGIGIEKGCSWGQAGQGFGNWSPMIFGAGEDSGMMWLSMSQNQLNSDPINFDVEIIGGNSPCWYKNGKFSTPGGCTTAAKPGTKVYYLLTEPGSSY